ncbi:hypothetical protein M3Y96_00905500 [Aphelenchoides besseyi]|nr:hypothetical protein M3Y96_00905500 [Aphelenchoides besseyi]
MAAGDSNLTEFKAENRLVTSLPVRRQTGRLPAEDDFFQLDEELNLSDKPTGERYDASTTEQVNKDDDDEDQNNDLIARSLPRNIDTGRSITSNEQSISITSTHRSPAFPRNVSSSRETRTVDEEEDGDPAELEDHITIERLEKKLEKIGANSDEAETAYSLREQTLFKNMQLLSLSVQPDDCPERIWGTNRELEIERQRRTSVLAREDENDGVSFGRSVTETTTPMARTYAGGPIDSSGVAPWPQSVAGHSIAVHRPKIMRPNGPRKFQGDRLPMNPRM